ncbi:MAG: hypothetical protein E5Y65_23815 [Mesorhizobium sp.]|nr:MAG: hypothetical protein EOS13_09475 [Mesorhizobium sp.]TIL76093.1 MAG: hypothetical protein E5Y70_05005 [Mesorhizobium sp.]TIL87382.1 MAG: hypothetical protein E5Y65_23815 [Mesorhizobium sp.]TIL97799.1 MAG: hypothetical protein E5Y64_29325 [Mesorhizobium sp.]TIM05662.1 MAG: hypothetical protein E5Y62_26570 [Mesorhizobium sp.]
MIAAGQRPPLSCRTSPPQGGRLAFITDFANYQPLQKRRCPRSCQSPPKVGEMSGRTEGGAKDRYRALLF